MSRSPTLRARKRIMKRFVTIRRFVFRKSVGVPVVLTFLGLAVGGEFLAQQSQQPYQFANSANCSSRTTAGCNTPAYLESNGHATQIPAVVAGQNEHPRYQPKRLPTVVLHNPAPNSALRIFPPTVTATPTTPPTPPTPEPTSLPPPQGQSSVVAMIEQVFGPYAQGALHVASCESGYNPGAYNPTSIGGSHAEGVFQILYPSTWMGTSEAAYSPYNAMANIQAAHEIFVRDGYSWREWSCAA